MTLVREIVHELDPHLRDTVASLSRRVADESVRRAWRFSTSLLVWILAPEVAPTRQTLAAHELLFSEERNGELFWTDLWHLASLLGITVAV